MKPPAPLQEVPRDDLAAERLAGEVCCFRLLAVLGIAWLPTLLDRGALAEASALFHLADGPHPYFQPAHAFLLYLRAPLCATSAGILVLSPGLFLTLAFGSAGGLLSWIVRSMAVSLLSVSSLVFAVQRFFNEPLRGHDFAGLVVLCSGLAFGILLLRLATGRRLDFPVTDRTDAASLASLVVMPWILMVLLAPKFLWEPFNGDGAHAFEAARLLLRAPLPFFPAEAGEISGFPGASSLLFLYPSSWFLRLFGDLEVAARLPFLLFLAVLFAAVVATAEEGAARRLAFGDRCLVWLGLAVYSSALAFSATYSPYSADLALPAPQDTLLMACFLGLLVAFVRREAGWMVVFTSLTCLSLPSGSMLVALWLAAALVVLRPQPWKSIAVTAGALVAFHLLVAAAPTLLRAAGLPPPGGEYRAVGLLRRFAFLQFTDFHRLGYLAIPCGIVPALSLLAWRRQDLLARALTVVSVAYFLLFYVQAHIALHHFVPVMVLPLVVFWRLGASTPPDRRGTLAAVVLAGAAAAIAISLMSFVPPSLAARRVGAAVEDRLGGYDTSSAAAFARSTSLREVFPYDWDPRVPESSFGGSPLVWYHYAHRGRGDGSVNYLFLPLDAGVTPLYREVARNEQAGLFLVDPEVWRRHLGIRPPVIHGSRWLQVPRGVLFRSVVLENGPLIVNVPAFLERLGLDLDPWLDRLGVERPSP